MYCIDFLSFYLPVMSSQRLFSCEKMVDSLLARRAQPHLSIKGRCPLNLQLLKNNIIDLVIKMLFLYMYYYYDEKLVLGAF